MTLHSLGIYTVMEFTFWLLYQEGNGVWKLDLEIKQ